MTSLAFDVDDCIEDDDVEPSATTLSFDDASFVASDDAVGVDNFSFRMSSVTTVDKNKK